MKEEIINILKLDIEWTIVVANNIYINSITPLLQTKLAYTVYDLAYLNDIICLETNIKCSYCVNKYGEVDLKIFIDKENIKDVVRLVGGIHKIINISNILEASNIIKVLPLEFM